MGRRVRAVQLVARRLVRESETETVADRKIISGVVKPGGGSSAPKTWTRKTPPANIFLSLQKFGAFYKAPTVTHSDQMGATGGYWLLLLRRATATRGQRQTPQVLLRVPAIEG